MAYEVDYTRHPQYLHVTVTGTNSPAAVSGYLRELLQECKRQNCYRVLIEERLQGPRLGVDDVFVLASEGAMNALGIFHALAYVDEQMGEMAGFAETVALNRGMPVRAFPTVAAARNWLLAQMEGTDERQIFTGDVSD